MKAPLALIVRKWRVQLVRPVDPAAIHAHHHLLIRFAEGRHDVMEILPQLLGIKVRHDFVEDFGGAILDRAHDTEQYPTGDAAPRAILPPRWAFEGLLAVDLALAQGADGEAHARGFAPPARPGQGKALENRFVFVEQDDFTPACPIFQGGEVE
jgi:hypothetical protein